MIYIRTNFSSFEFSGSFRIGLLGSSNTLGVLEVVTE